MNKVLVNRSRFLEQTNVVLFKFLFTFFLIFSPIVASASENEEFAPPQYNQSTIYVAPGTVVHGLEHITVTASDVVFYVAPDTSISVKSAMHIGKPMGLAVLTTKETTKTHQKAFGRSKKLTSKTEAKDKTLQRLQDKVQHRLLKTIYTKSEEGSQSWTLYSYRNTIAVGLNYTASSSFAKIVNAFEHFEHRFIVQSARQNFYTIVQDVTFVELSSTSLRGPPLSIG